MWLVAYRKFVAVLAVVVLLGGMVSGCTSKGSQEILIGVVAPMTGETPTFGTSTKNGVMLAVEEINAAGGIGGKKIKIIVEDDKGDAVEAANAGRKLVNQDKVIGIVGSVYSSCSLAIAPTAQQAKIPMISPTSTAEKVTLTGDFIFRACFIDPFQGFVMAKFAYDELGSRKATVLYDLANDYTKGLAEEFKKHFERMGGQVVGFETHASGDQDFKAQITKMKGTNADVLFLPAYYQTSALQAKQVRELGWDVQLIGADGWDSADLVTIGGDAIEGGFFCNHYSPESDAPVARTFLNNYKAKYGSTPDALAALAYDAAMILFEAIKKADSLDGTKIRDAMANTNMTLVSGPTTYDEFRNPVKAAVVIRIEGGQQKFHAVVNP